MLTFARLVPPSAPRGTCHRGSAPPPAAKNNQPSATGSANVSVQALTFRSVRSLSRSRPACTRPSP